MKVSTTTVTVLDDLTSPEHDGATRVRLLLLAYHYQELAHRHPDEERFWLCRATYYGRLAAQARDRSGSDH